MILCVDHDTFCHNLLVGDVVTFEITFHYTKLTHERSKSKRLDGERTIDAVQQPLLDFVRDNFGNTGDITDASSAVNI